MEDFKELVKNYEDKNRNSIQGYVVDYFGCKTNIKHYQHLNSLNGKILSFPDPSDGILHEFIEYVGSCFALKNATNNFQCVELGAGNGIWCARMGVVTKRKHFRKINLIAVEVDPTKAKWIEENFKENKLRSNLFSKINIKIYNNAIGINQGNMYFPKLDNPDYDYGPAPSNNDDNYDYRGLEIKNMKVKVIPISTVITGVTDLLHVDIQGGESNLLINSIELLNKYVKVLVLGTHSRKIEGDMFDLFYKSKWNLLMEKPCQFVYNPISHSLEGMTTVDGNQIWYNPKLVTDNKEIN